LGEAALEAMQMGAAEQIQSYAKAIVPVDTGDLQDSIQIGHDGDAVTVYSDMPYAGYVEYGTSVPTPAQPYLRPAADTVDPDGITSIGASIMNRM
jgi:HK97 gp10 family phage protein